MKKLRDKLAKGEERRLDQQKKWIGWKPWHPWLVVIRRYDRTRRYRFARTLEEGRETVLDSFDDPGVESGWVIEAAPRKPAQ